jgi:CheY-like chemotaxis protein
LTGKLVVVIDDEPAIVQGMKLLLSGWGATVISSDSGEDVVAAVHAAGKLPDLIIADYQLGAGRNGIEMVERIRQDLDPAIPAILVTGTMVPDLVESARGARLEFLLKPVIPETLRSLIGDKLQLAPGAPNANPSPSEPEPTA